MLEAGRDAAPVAVDGAAALASGEKIRIAHVPAVAILNARGEFSATLGCLPPILRPMVVRLPWFAAGQKAVRQLAGIAVAAVATRLAMPPGSTRKADLLAKLQDGVDENGAPMGREELTAEALTQLIAGSDTTSKYVTNPAYFHCSDLSRQLLLRYYLLPCETSRKAK